MVPVAYVELVVAASADQLGILDVGQGILVASRAEQGVRDLEVRIADADNPIAATAAAVQRLATLPGIEIVETRPADECGRTHPPATRDQVMIAAAGRGERGFQDILHQKVADRK